MHELALFAGAGGGILAGQLVGWRTVCAVEINAFCREVLLRRQMDGCLPRFPIWDDVRTFEGRTWRGLVDVISGGFPCTDISCAGKGAGIHGEQSRLWREFARVIREVEPRFVFVENSPMLTVRGLGTVLGDLAEMGFDAEWCVLGADDVGAPHRRKRIWILAANSDSVGCEGQRFGGILDIERPALRNDTDGCCSTISDADEIRRNGRAWMQRGGRRGEFEDGSRRSTESDLGGMANGMARRMDTPWTYEPADIPRVGRQIPYRVNRLAAIGNGQVPMTAAVAFQLLAARLGVA